MEHIKKEMDASDLDSDVVISDLGDAFKKITKESITIELDGDTYEIDADAFNLTFCVSDMLFEIRNIDTRGIAGVGGKVLSLIHSFADERGLSVVASNVKDVATGFWRKMGYQQSEEEGEFFRP